MRLGDPMLHPGGGFVRFSPDGKTLASRGAEGWSTRLWDVATGGERLKLPTMSCSGVDYSPDGKSIATRELWGLRTWDLQTGKLLLALNVPQSQMLTAMFTPDGDPLVCAVKDGTARIWDVATGEELQRLPQRYGRIRSALFSPRGKVLAVGAQHGTVLWDVTEGEELRTLGGQAVSEGALRLAFSDDGMILASTLPVGNQLHLWDVTTGKELAMLQAKLDAPGPLHSHSLGMAALSFSPNAKKLATANFDGTVRLWDVATRKEIHTLRGHKSRVTSVDFSPDGKSLASAGDTILLWDVSTGENLIDQRQGHASSVSSLAFSPNGQILVSASVDNILFWDSANGNVLRRLGPETGNVVTMSADGNLLASVKAWGPEADFSIHLWGVATGKEIRKMQGHTAQTRCVAFSPDGKMIASGSQDNTIRLWDPQTGEQLREWPLEGYCQSIGFSPDGRTLAFDLGKTIRIRDITTGDDLVKLEGHGNLINQVAFSPDGRTLASASWDKTARLWDVVTGKELYRLQAHGSFVHCVAFSRSGEAVASGGENGTVILWNVTSGKQIKKLGGHRDEVFAIAFSPDGKKLASAGRDTTIVVWDLARVLAKP